MVVDVVLRSGFSRSKATLVAIFEATSFSWWLFTLVNIKKGDFFIPICLESAGDGWTAGLAFDPWGQSWPALDGRLGLARPPCRPAIFGHACAAFHVRPHVDRPHVWLPVLPCPALSGISLRFRPRLGARVAMMARDWPGRPWPWGGLSSHEGAIIHTYIALINASNILCQFIDNKDCLWD
jgi:hypothetical protein